MRDILKVYQRHCTPQLLQKLSAPALLFSLLVASQFFTWPFSRLHFSWTYSAIFSAPISTTNQAFYKNVTERRGQCPCGFWVRNVWDTFFSLSFNKSQSKTTQSSIFSTGCMSFQSNAWFTLLSSTAKSSLPSLSEISFSIIHYSSTLCGSGHSSCDSFLTLPFLCYFRVFLLALPDVLFLQFNLFFSITPCIKQYVQAKFSSPPFLCTAYITEPLQCNAGVWQVYVV